MIVRTLALLLTCVQLPPSLPITCRIGYGQRGLKQSGGIEWPRNCPDATYCWEARTDDKALADGLLTYHWDDYYDEYFVRGCAGDYGTDKLRAPASKFNLSLPVDIKGKGGVALVRLGYACRMNMCSDAQTTRRLSALPLGLALFALCFALS